jgi:short-subunit dehydrogenase
MSVVLLGATQGMGRALARLLAARGETLGLLGRNLVELERSARDLELHGAARPVAVAHADLEQPAGFDRALAAIEAEIGGFDSVVVSAAMFATQDELETSPELTERLLHVDFTATVLFCEAARKRLLARGGGTLCVFGSVAGDRGRKPVVLYGAAKAGLAAYLEGLDHRYHRQGLCVVCVKPGFVRTGMTAELDAPPFAGEPEAVAARVLAAIDRGTPVVYAPPTWRAVMAIVRRLPRAAMRRVSF